MCKKEYHTMYMDPQICSDVKKIHFLKMLKKQKYDNMRDYAGLDLTVREGFLKKYA